MTPISGSHAAADSGRAMELPALYAEMLQAVANEQFGRVDQDNDAYLRGLVQIGTYFHDRLVTADLSKIPPCPS